jgi:hypothetical protein
MSRPPPLPWSRLGMDAGVFKHEIMRLPAVNAQRFARHRSGAIATSHRLLAFAVHGARRFRSNVAAALASDKCRRQRN